MPTHLRFPRSLLYVPGNRPDRFPKAAGSGADAVILDLEDAVPVSQRDEARCEVAAWLGAAHGVDRPQWWVRLPPEYLAEDLEALPVGHLSGVMLSKVTVAALGALDGALGSNGASEDLFRVGLVETATSFAGLGELTRHSSLTTLGIGEVDLLADLGIARSPRTRAVIDGLRAQVVLQCAAAGLLAPIGPTSTDFRDLDGFAESTRLLLDLGFGARTAIHPSQVKVIHEVMQPSPAEVAEAMDVLARYDGAGLGVALDAQGRLIDGAVVRHARRILARSHAPEPERDT